MRFEGPPRLVVRRGRVNGSATAVWLVVFCDFRFLLSLAYSSSLLSFHARVNSEAFKERKFKFGRRSFRPSVALCILASYMYNSDVCREPERVYSQERHTPPPPSPLSHPLPTPPFLSLTFLPLKRAWSDCRYRYMISALPTFLKGGRSFSSNLRTCLQVSGRRRC